MKPCTFFTEESDALCREIAKKSRGVCFCGFSGGKDSLCALISLHRYFHRIIAFHCTSWPGMRYVGEYLDKVEYMMDGLHILRLIGEDFPMALDRMMYQPMDTCMEVEEKGFVCEDYSKLDILEYLRYKYSLPKAWCAFGINMNDSMDRRIYIKRTGGKNPQNKTFYPCLNWPREEILNTIRDAGIPLISSYRYWNRTMGNVPGIVTNEILKAHYPEDWKRYLALYPLAEAKTVRERILAREWARTQRERIEANGGRASADGAASARQEPDDGIFDGDWMEDGVK